MTRNTLVFGRYLHLTPALTAPRSRQRKKRGPSSIGAGLVRRLYETTASRRLSPLRPSETDRRSTMRFMMLMIPKGYETAKPGTIPADTDKVAAMMKYNESLQKAGVLLALDGLHPPSMGARVSFPGGKPKVVDGPFAEAKEVVGGYWMIQVKSREEAIEWARRCPGGENETIEIRQVHEMSEFPEDIQKIASKLGK
jgi:hypothetical protein